MPPGYTDIFKTLERFVDLQHDTNVDRMVETLSQCPGNPKRPQVVVITSPKVLAPVLENL